MFLFKASGATYKTVVKQSLHAFPHSPKDARDQFVLLSKNREDCGLLEKQIQHVAKLLAVRPASERELNERFPGAAAGSRWTNIVELYWLRPLAKPFNLSDVDGFNSTRYNPVQGFVRLDSIDDDAMLKYLILTNEKLVLDVVSNAERPKSG